MRVTRTTRSTGTADTTSSTTTSTSSTTPPTDVLGGTATVDARATQNLSRFDLDFVGMTCRSVKIDGRSAAWAPDGQELVITA